MKKNITIIFLSLFVIIAIFTYTKTFSNEESELEVGRYQLFQGEYIYWDFADSPSDDLAKLTVREGIFRIDSKTGNVWQLFDGIKKDGITFSVWSPMVGNWLDLHLK